MGRIVVNVKVTNHFDGGKSLQTPMLVDTGAGALILPASWQHRLGKFQHAETVELPLANGDAIRGDACAPVEIKIDGFRPVFNEVVFVESQHAEDGQDEEPLLGYVILEQAQAAVDMLGHRLVPVRYIDMKQAAPVATQ